MPDWRDMYRDNEFVSQEIATAWEWMSQHHTAAEWKGFIDAITIMYLNCNKEMRDSVKMVLNEATTRKLLSGGK